METNHVFFVRGSMTATLYVVVLQITSVPYLDGVFQQNNARAHIARQPTDFI